MIAANRYDVWAFVVVFAIAGFVVIYFLTCYFLNELAQKGVLFKSKAEKRTEQTVRNSEALTRIARAEAERAVIRVKQEQLLKAAEQGPKELNEALTSMKQQCCPHYGTHRCTCRCRRCGAYPCCC